ncbi:MAG: glycosyltransferase family 2 protein [Hydrococcus sp. C42_A2020_068]|nr:glycosyltransferase family 2 protein [Hydrococcus sp. C42_A2020_068]
MPALYFLTVNYHSTELVDNLIQSISRYKNIPYQIVIVNNSPENKSIYFIKNKYLFILDSPKNLGFGGACNLGLNWIYTQNPKAIVWIINPDACLLENNFKKLIQFFNNYSEVSIFGTIIYNAVKKIWFAGGRFIPATGAIFTEDLVSNTDSAYVSCDWVSGCSLIINLRNFSECPQFDPAYFLYYEDFDFCRRYAEQGHLIAITKQFSVIHQPSSITDRNPFQKIKHSTYSYLLTLERYTNKLFFILRLIRLTFNASVLIFIKPKKALGKVAGILNYFMRSHRVSL